MTNRPAFFFCLFMLSDFNWQVKLDGIQWFSNSSSQFVCKPCLSHFICLCPRVVYEHCIICQKCRHAGKFGGPHSFVASPLSTCRGGGEDWSAASGTGLCWLLCVLWATWWLCTAYHCCKGEKDYFLFLLNWEVSWIGSCGKEHSNSNITTLWPHLKPMFSLLMLLRVYLTSAWKHGPNGRMLSSCCNEREKLKLSYSMPTSPISSSRPRMR